MIDTNTNVELKNVKFTIELDGYKMLLILRSVRQAIQDTVHVNIFDNLVALYTSLKNIECEKLKEYALVDGKVVLKKEEVKEEVKKNEE